jgi:hypothetical protein
MSNIESEVTMALTVTRANKKPFTVRPLIEARPAEPTPEQRYPTLFGIKDGRAWLNNLAGALDAVSTEDEVAEIGGLSSVTKTLQAAPQDVQDKVRGLLAAAMERVSSAPGFESDRAPEVENDPALTDGVEGY